MKSSRKNSSTDLNNMYKYALFKVAHFQTNEKTLPERKGRVFLLIDKEMYSFSFLPDGKKYRSSLGLQQKKSIFVAI